MIDKKLIIKTLETFKDGFTLDLKTGEHIKKGFAVAITHNIPLNDIKTLFNTIKINSTLKKAVGGWVDSNTKAYYLDFVLITTTQEEALYLARVFNQIAIFDLKNLKEVRL